MKNKNYNEFLKSKVCVASQTGFDIKQEELHPVLLPHQRAAVQWALKGGRRALFEAFGLGKSVQELEFCRQVIKHKGGRALIVLPLGVKQEFTRDAVELLGMEAPQYVRNMEEIAQADGDILVTNYERVRDGNIDPKGFTAACLDEASVLRSFGSKTYQTFLPLFNGIPFKLVATATPDPNKYKELIHYSAFLEVMDSGQALTRFFQRDSTKADNLTLYPHKEEEFWLWVSTWALFLQKPSDLGFSDEGYVLPPMDIRWHCIPSDAHGGTNKKTGQIALVNNAAAGLTEAAREKRESLDARIETMREIVDGDPDAHFILWHDLEDERHAIKKALPESVEVYGAQEIEEKEARVIDFSEGRTRLLATKKEISGQGCNFQRHCHRAVFLGIDYKFNDFIQAIHRIYRFMQKEPVIIDIIYTENEKEIKTELLAKWERYNHQNEKMRELIVKNGVSQKEIIAGMCRSMGVKRVEIKGKNWTAVNNDCVDELTKMADNSVGLIHTSIPFCYDEETEILTSEGWKSFLDVTSESEIATYNKTEKRIEYQKPSHIVWERYNGEMIEFSGRAFRLNVTPNHRMWAERRNGNSFEVFTADEITKAYENAKRKAEGNQRILRSYKLQVAAEVAVEGEKPGRIFIPKLPESEKQGHGVELYWIETKDFMRLAGWYLSEGHADSFDKRAGGRIGIGQSPIVNRENYEEIKAMFWRIGLPPSEGKNQVTVWCRNLAYYMREQFGDRAGNKRIPRWIFNLDGELLTILRDTMMKGDGSKKGDSFASISPALRNDFQELCVLTGWRAKLTRGKWIYTANKEIYPEIRKIPKRYPYSGMIGCVKVPNGLVVVRRDGFVAISGNSNHYEYTPSYNDFGHNEDNDRFFEQMDYLTPELLRVLEPGRVAAIHVKDRILFGNATGDGMPTVDPFSDMTVFHFLKHGFKYMGRIVILTDVVRENNQTYRLGWTEQCRDGSKMGVGCPEYVLLFRKLPSDTSRAYADDPVVKPKEEYTRARWQLDAHAFWRCSGDRFMTKDELKLVGVADLGKAFRKFCNDTIYDYEAHVKLYEALDENGKLPATFMVAPPSSWSDEVWDDITRMKTLNTTQSHRRQVLHVCPLPIEIPERIINRYSNPGDLVLDPFGGLMTVPLCAIKAGRRGYGIELNCDYFRDGVGYLQQEEKQVQQFTLFDLLRGSEEAAV